MLASLKITANEAKDILTLAKEQGHFQVACQRHFDAVHPDHGQTEPAANHPNAWIQASMQYYQSKSGNASTKAPKVGHVTDDATTTDKPPTQVQVGPSHREKQSRKFESDPASVNDDDFLAMEGGRPTDSNASHDDAAYEAMLAMEE
jgi:Eukaryotic and archaeal DNA primase, large subunit